MIVLISSIVSPFIYLKQRILLKNNISYKPTEWFVCKDAQDNELIFDDLKDSPPEDEDSVIPPVLIFAKEPKGGPYIFRGVYLKNKEKSEHRHHVYYRIGTKVRLVGQPSEKIEILDDFRKKEGNV